MSNQDAGRVIREKKGLSLLEFPKDYILIDLETTGLSPIYNEIIEISALKIKDGEVIDTFSELIKPKYEIDGFIAKLTGITNEMVRNSREVKEVISDFMNFINKDDILVGYNVNFDINFLYDNLLRASNKFLENNFVDIMRIAKYALKDKVDSFRLKKLANYYEIDTNGMHRGEKDCQVSKIIFEKVQELILDKHQTHENFLEARKKAQYLNSKDIVSENKEFDLSHQGYNKQFVFTGTLTRLTRKDAMQLVVDFGGKVNGGVNKETNFLVMGDLDYSKTVTGEKSSKIIKAETLKLKGQDIEIIPEEVFYDIFEIITTGQ
ncbi:exonuclease domain-containing protein [Cetobacterium sp.]|uniref:exonuclease domain-containing protein n=1 Tax=Cetobacterium sp. TaxID=2071632 RepID=UPI003F31A47E